MSKRQRSVTVALVAMLLTGCAVGPNYRAPAVKSPDLFRGTGDSNSLSQARNSTHTKSSPPCACSRCHNFARVLSWRRSVDDWRELLNEWLMYIRIANRLTAANSIV